MNWHLCTVAEISAQLHQLAHRICDDCGHPDGICGSCHRMHAPATPGGCEVCAPVDEDGATYYDGQGELL